MKIGVHNSQTNFGISTFASVMMWMGTSTLGDGYPWWDVLFDPYITPTSLGLWLILHLMTWGIMAWNANLLVEMYN